MCEVMRLSEPLKADFAVVSWHNHKLALYVASYMYSRHACMKRPMLPKVNTHTHMYMHS